MTSDRPDVTIRLSDDEHYVLLDALVSHLDVLTETKRDHAPAMQLYQRLGSLSAEAAPGQEAMVNCVPVNQQEAQAIRDLLVLSAAQTTEAGYMVSPPALDLIHRFEAVASSPPSPDQPDARGVTITPRWSRGWTRRWPSTWRDWGEVITNIGDLRIETYVDDDVLIGSGPWDCVYIPAEHRPAVALAILGGVTDQLVERVARRRLESWAQSFRPTLRWSDLNEFEVERYLVDARDHINTTLADIAEIFGIEATE